MTKRLRVQRGITLMEIMISMGVALVGIMGIMSLMPLAAVNLSKGVQADAVSTFGRGALHDFTAREMIHGDWIAVDNANQLFRLPEADARRTRASFCIDPLYMASHTAFAFASLPTVATTADTMPYYDLSGDLSAEPPYSQPRMFRCAPPRVSTGTDKFPISTALAQHVFTSHDDLSFVRPNDRALPPVQTYNRINDTNPADAWENAPRLRQSKGRFSWMATVVPEIDNNATISDEFRRLSIVIFHDRVIDPAINQFAPSDGDQELLFDVILLGSGIAGGDVRLMTRPSRSGSADDLSELRVGNWIMLGGAVVPAVNGVFRQQFRWYRVVDMAATTSVMTDYNGTRVWTRDVTLVGPDWIRPEWLNYKMDESPEDNLMNYGTMRTQATWLRGVVSVLEKTVVVR
ncbi:MAG: hypothetical protein ABGX22_08620 [Pirellulaceae bacterium]